MDANLARRTEPKRRMATEAHATDDRSQVGIVNDLVRSQALRVLLVLVSLGCSAIVVEAGRRWL